MSQGYTRNNLATNTPLMVIISSQEASGNSEITFTSGMSGYKYYILELINVVLDTYNSRAFLQYSIDGGGTYEATNYAQGGVQEGSTTGGGFNVAAQAQLYLTNQVDDDAPSSINSYNRLYNLESTALHKLSFTETTCVGGDSIDAGSVFYLSVAGLWNGSTSAVNALKVYAESGLITSGTIRLLGVS